MNKIYHRYKNDRSLFERMGAKTALVILHFRSRGEYNPTPDMNTSKDKTRRQTNPIFPPVQENLFTGNFLAGSTVFLNPALFNGS